VDYPQYTIEREFPRQPASCVFKILLNLQLWWSLQKAKNLMLLDEMVVMTKNLFSTKK
jgi:hypothetical protein